MSILVTFGNAYHTKLKVGDFSKDLANIADGKGGGRPDRASAGAKKPQKEQDIMNNVNKKIEELI